MGTSRHIPISKADRERLALEFEAGLSRAILRNGTDLRALQILGHSLSRLGSHEEALDVDRRVTELLPNDEIAYYNLACSYSNLGRVDEALQALRRAVHLGYADLQYMSQDPDLENVRRDPRYPRIVEQLDGAKKSGNPRG